MARLIVNTNPKVETVFNNYPSEVKEKLQQIRQLILETAEYIESITEIEETLKWGEPSYITKIGSTLRLDWKAKNPNHYALYFQCTSKLVPTFKLMYNNTFTFEGTRAIILKLEDKIPTEPFKNCIKATPTYHKVKHLATLGI